MHGFCKGGQYYGAGSSKVPRAVRVLVQQGGGDAGAAVPRERRLVLRRLHLL